MAGALVARTLGSGPELELCPPVAGGAPRGTALAFDTESGPICLWFALLPGAA